MSDTAPEEIVLVIPGDPVPWAPKQTMQKNAAARFVPARQAQHAGKVVDAWERSIYRDRFFVKGSPLQMIGHFFLTRPKSHYGSGANAKKLRAAPHHANPAPLYPTGRPDGSNLLKLIEDALTGVAWADDDQFIDGNFSKRFVDWWEPSRSVIRITPL